MQPTQVEVLGRAWLTGQLLRVGIDLARPDRDTGVDLIAYPADLAWFCPMQLKVVTGDGITVWRKYVGLPLAVVYVFLGTTDGGLGRRRDTQTFVMSPEQACDLPRRCRRHFAPEHLTYRFDPIHSALHELLELYTVADEQWHERLPGMARRPEAAEQPRD